MSKITKISSIIIAKNEAHNIKRCIESQLECIDDIVVLVDITSTDGTYEIVSSYEKVVCEKVEWHGYSKTKQLAVEKTQNDWILWIDADEEVTAELSYELNGLKNSEPDSSALQVARRAYFLGKWIKHSGWYPSYVVRLFNKQKAGFNDNKVHEGLDVNGKIGRLKNDLNHYTDPNIKHYFDKFNRYTTLAADELNFEGKRASLKDLLIRPIFLFVKMYILRKGFLDGVHGFILAVFSSTYVFTKYSKLWELNQKKSYEDRNNS